MSGRRAAGEVCVSRSPCAVGLDERVAQLAAAVLEPDAGTGGVHAWMQAAQCAAQAARRQHPGAMRDVGLEQGEQARPAGSDQALPGELELLRERLARLGWIPDQVVHEGSGLRAGLVARSCCELAADPLERRPAHLAQLLL